MVITILERGESSQQSAITTHQTGRGRDHIDPDLYQAATEADVASEADAFTTTEIREIPQQSVITIHQTGGGRAYIDPDLYQTASKGDVAHEVDSLTSCQSRSHMDSELYLAASEGNVQFFTRLEGGNLVQPDELAINVADVAPAERREVNLLGVTHAGDTALHIATCFGHYQVAQWICNENKSLLIQGNDKDETPLHYAAQAGEIDLVRLFIKQAGNDAADLVRMRNLDGETALYQAIHHCQVLTVDNSRRLYFKFSLLHFLIGQVEQASAENNIRAKVVEALLDADGTVASISNNNNISPLYLAVMQNSFTIVTYLVQSLRQSAQSDSLKAYEGPDGRTALHAAAVRHAGFIRVLLLGLRQQLTKIRDNSGRTPLHFAASTNHLSGLHLLLGADKDSAYITDASGLYPIHVASKLGSVQSVALFFQHCPDSGELLDRKGRNFLHLAVEERKANVVWWACQESKLVKAMNSQDNNGDTPMHLAIKGGDLNIFSILLASRKTRICIMNRDGLRPLDVATANRTVGFWNRQVRDIYDHPLYKTTTIINILKSAC